jgi:hypothetical protein
VPVNVARRTQAALSVINQSSSGKQEMHEKRDRVSICRSAVNSPLAPEWDRGAVFQRHLQAWFQFLPVLSSSCCGLGWDCEVCTYPAIMILAELGILVFVHSLVL